MSNQASAHDYELAPVKFSRLTRRGVLLGLSGSQLVVVGIGAIVLVFALYFGGSQSLLYVVPLLLLCAALAFVGVGGRKIVEWLPVVTKWLWRSTGGQLLFRRHIVKPRPAGTLSLPGDAARLRQWFDPESGAVMVHDPHAATLTAIVGVTHPAFILLDPIEQQRRVTSWGRVLATACRSGRIASLQVMERTLPDSGKGLAEWWSQHGHHNDSWTSTTYDELINRAGPAGERHASTVSISLDLKAVGRAIRAAGGGNRGAAAVLRQEMSTMTAALRAADLAPSGWLEPGDVAVIRHRRRIDPFRLGDAGLEERAGMEMRLVPQGVGRDVEQRDRERGDAADQRRVLRHGAGRQCKAFPKQARRFVVEIKQSCGSSHLFLLSLPDWPDCAGPTLSPSLPWALLPAVLSSPWCPRPGRFRPTSSLRAA